MDVFRSVWKLCIIEGTHSILMASESLINTIDDIQLIYKFYSAWKTIRILWKMKRVLLFYWELIFGCLITGQRNFIEASCS